VVIVTIDGQAGLALHWVSIEKRIRDDAAEPTNTAYSWYAMRHGAMLGGVDETTVSHDLRSLPRISMDFFLVGIATTRKKLTG
jgi:hypothetical protein